MVVLFLYITRFDSMYHHSYPLHLHYTLRALFTCVRSVSYKYQCLY
jgi:hypothetical protein